MLLKTLGHRIIVGFLLFKFLNYSSLIRSILCTTNKIYHKKQCILTQTQQNKKIKFLSNLFLNSKDFSIDFLWLNNFLPRKSDMFWYHWQQKFNTFNALINHIINCKQKYIATDWDILTMNWLTNGFGGFFQALRWCYLMVLWLCRNETLMVS